MAGTYLTIRGGCESILRDYAKGEHSSEIRLLVTVLEEGFCKELGNTSEKDNNFAKNNFVRLFHDKHFTDKSIVSRMLDLLLEVLQDGKPKGEPQAAAPENDAHPPPLRRQRKDQAIRRNRLRKPDKIRAEVQREKQRDLWARDGGSGCRKAQG